MKLNLETVTLPLANKFSSQDRIDPFNGLGFQLWLHAEPRGRGLTNFCNLRRAEWSCQNYLCERDWEQNIENKGIVLGVETHLTIPKLQKFPLDLWWVFRALRVANFERFACLFGGLVDVKSEKAVIQINESNDWITIYICFVHGQYIYYNYPQKSNIRK